MSYKVLHMSILWHSASDCPAQVVEGKGSIRLLFHHFLESVKPEPANALSLKHSINDLQKFDSQSNLGKLLDLGSLLEKYSIFAFYSSSSQAQDIG